MLHLNRFTKNVGLEKYRLQNVDFNSGKGKYANCMLYCQEKREEALHCPVLFKNLKSSCHSLQITLHTNQESRTNHVFDRVQSLILIILDDVRGVIVVLNGDILRVKGVMVHAVLQLNIPELLSYLRFQKRFHNFKNEERCKVVSYDFMFFAGCRLLKCSYLCRYGRWSGHLYMICILCAR